MTAIKTPEDVERQLDLPVLGFVAEMQYKSSSPEEVYVARQPRSPVSEAFRSLRTNLEFASVQKPIRTLIVTSPGPAEGKTTVAVNLAAIIALSGKRVALVDADLRRPMVHKLLGLPNRDGLSTLFRGHEGVHTVFRSKLELPHLMVITSGSLPPNPAELLGSERMVQILEELSALVDVVVIDTPPSLVADAQILSARVDARPAGDPAGKDPRRDRPGLPGSLQACRGAGDRGRHEPHPAQPGILLWRLSILFGLQQPAGLLRGNRACGKGCRRNRSWSCCAALARGPRFLHPGQARRHTRKFRPASFPGEAWKIGATFCPSIRHVCIFKQGY